MTGTIHHDYCPICGNQTVDREDGYCKYAYCGQDESDIEDETAHTIFDGTPDWLRMEE